MDNSGSRASVESSCDDFVIVGGDARVHIEGGVSHSEMKEDLEEILCVEEGNESSNICDVEIMSVNKENECRNYIYKELDISNLSESDQNDDSSFSNLGSDMKADKLQCSVTNEANFIDNLDKNNIVNNYNVNVNINDIDKLDNNNNNKDIMHGRSLEKINDSADNESPKELLTSTFKTTSSFHYTSHSTSPPSSIISMATTIMPTTTMATNTMTTNTMSTNNMSTETYSVDEEAIMFSGVLYLGSTMIGVSRSEAEVNRIIASLNNNNQSPLSISLSVPPHSDGNIYLIDASSNTIISSHPIHQILFCARGPINTMYCNCFAFTCSHDNTTTSCSHDNTTTSFQCHVFRTDDPLMNVGKILYHFATAFRHTHKTSSLSSSLSPSPPSPPPLSSNDIHVKMIIDIRELDAHNQFVSCPKDKDVFKLRCDVEKQVMITIKQESGDIKLNINKCFGVLLSAGRNVKFNNMSVLEVLSVTQSSDHAYVILANLNPTLSQFQLINTLTPKDSRIFVTIGVDVAAVRFREAIKFICEIKAILLPHNHKFWYSYNRLYVNHFILYLKESEESSAIGCDLELLSILNKSNKQKKKKQPMLESIVSIFQSSLEQQSDNQYSDNDEPLLSGSGVVSKEVTDDALLQSWKEVLVKWHQNVKVRPRGVESLVRKGVPEALRGEVWQLLVGCTEDDHMFEAYRLLIAKESPCDDVITRDLNRTFPAHEFFQDGGGVGQESLYRICKAYSIYDTEVSYCQGVSFLTAALLLHMPEEQAFCVLVRTMYSYGLRELFRMDFEDLHLKFFQLERCIEDHMCKLHEHFVGLGLEAHMYASQWFLTLFTAKFPLFLVFSILDLFFSQGMPTVFGVALALLKMSRKDLLELDFEGIFKYLRVQLPKKYRSETAAREMISCAISITPSEKKLKRYEGVYRAHREEQLQLQDPIQILKIERNRLQETNLRLERENDALAGELVNSKIALRKQLDEVEDKYDHVNKELLVSRSMVLDAEEEKKMLTHEILQLKELCRRESQNVQRGEQDSHIVIHDYKQMCTQLSTRIKQITQHHQAIKEITTDCSECQKKMIEFENNEYIGDASLANTSTNDMKGNNLCDVKDNVIGGLELELAQTKLALVECECRNQDLMHLTTSSNLHSPNHHLNTPYSSICNNAIDVGGGSSGGGGNSGGSGNKGSSGGSGNKGSSDGSGNKGRSSWIQKTLNSIKEATAVKHMNTQ